MSADIASQVTGRLGAGWSLLLLLGVAAAVAAGVSIICGRGALDEPAGSLDSDDRRGHAFARGGGHRHRAETARLSV